MHPVPGKAAEALHSHQLRFMLPSPPLALLEPYTLTVRSSRGVCATSRLGRHVIPTHPTPPIPTPNPQPKPKPMLANTSRPRPFTSTPQPDR